MIFIAFAAALFTLLGGLFALRFNDKLHLILGFSAGAVIGVAFFDLLPEALELAAPSFGEARVTTVVAAGFFIYLLLDRLMLFHSHAEIVDHEHGHGHSHDHRHATRRGLLGASSLAMHSFLDGIAIGLAFQASASVGVIVAVAVLVHDFSDGINTVNMIIKNQGSRKNAFKWLMIDALAPALGILSTHFFRLPPDQLGLLLAVFCGFFLYIGASDLLPESYHRHSTFWTTIATLFGAATLYTAIQIAGF